MQTSHGYWLRSRGGPSPPTASGVTRSRQRPAYTRRQLRSRVERRGYCFKGRKFARTDIDDRWPTIQRSVATKGMVNPGQWCYRRAVMVSLLHLPRFVNFLNLDHEDCQHDPDHDKTKDCDRRDGRKSADNGHTCSLCRFIDLSYEYWRPPQPEQKATHHRPVNALDTSLNAFFRNGVGHQLIRRGVQQDAAEYLGLLLQALRDSQHVPHAAPQPAITEDMQEALFEIDYTETTTAVLPPPFDPSSCAHAHLDSPTSCILAFSTLANGFQDGQTLETLIQNQYNQKLGLQKCLVGGCGIQTERQQETRITKAPQILIIHLNRVSDEGRKDDNRVKLSNELDLSPYSDLTPARLVYRLDAVVYHFGKLAHIGHYVAVVRSPSGDITYVNDSMSRVLSNKDALLLPPDGKGEATILFYSRI